MKKLLIACLCITQFAASFAQSSELDSIKTEVSYRDSLRVLQDLIKSLKPSNVDGLPKNTYNLDIDSCSGTFELNRQNLSSKGYVTSSDIIKGKLNDIAECLINGDEKSCSITIKSKYNKFCFTRASTKKVFGFPDEEEITTHFIYLGEFRANNLQKLVRLKTLLTYFLSEAPLKPLTPNFFKQDTNLIQLTEKFEFEWDETAKVFKQSKNTSISGVVRFTENTINFENELTLEIGPPFKDEFSGRIAFQVNHPEIVGVLFDPDGKNCTLVAEFYEIIYETKLEEKLCP